MYIKRDYYLQKLIRRKENGMVKVIAGLRRSGKSFLLFNLYHDYLVSSGIKEDQIIPIALDDRQYSEYRDVSKLDAFIRSKLRDSDRMHYIFIVDNPAIFTSGIRKKFTSRIRKLFTRYDRWRPEPPPDQDSYSSLTTVAPSVRVLTMETL